MGDARPGTFSALWVEGALGPYEQLALRSFVVAGCPVELYTYDEHLDAPPGVTRRDAVTIVSDERRRAFPGGDTHFSNLFRYELLRARDTTWIDTDMVLLDATVLPDRSHLFGRQASGQVNTALLALPRSSPALVSLVAGSDIPAGTPLRWGLLGPELLTNTLVAHGLADRALDSSALYSINWEDIWRLFEPDQIGWCEHRTRGAAGLHLWNQYLRKGGLKDFAPPADSFLGRLADGVGVPFGLPEVPADVLQRFRSKWDKNKDRPLRRLMRRLRTVR